MTGDSVDMKKPSHRIAEKGKEVYDLCWIIRMKSSGSERGRGLSELFLQFISILDKAQIFRKMGEVPIEYFGCCNNVFSMAL